MPMQQALVPEDLSAMRLLTVPDVWPPIDPPPAAAAQCQRPTGSALVEQAGHRPGERGDGGHVWPRQFAVLLAEALAGARPLRQVLPWMSERGSMQLRRALPLFGGGHRPRILRVLTAAPSPDVIEMTLIVAAGPRTRAVAVRLERSPQAQRRTAPPWLCTDIEAA